MIKKEKNLKFVLKWHDDFSAHAKQCMFIMKSNKADNSA